MSSFVIKQGDYHRRIACTLGDVDATGASGVIFRMRPNPSGALVVNNAGNIDSASSVSYQFQSPQLDTPGKYYLEIAVQFPDGTETVPTMGYVDVWIMPSLA